MVPPALAHDFLLFLWTLPYGLPLAHMFLTAFILPSLLPIPPDMVHLLQQGLVWLRWPRTLGDPLGFVVGLQGAQGPSSSVTSLTG